MILTVLSETASPESHEKKESVKIGAEEIFQSKSRTKLLMILAKEGELNISALCKRANVNNQTARAHLKVLVNAGILQEKRFGRIRIYRLKVEVIKVGAIRSFFEVWERNSLY